MPYKTYGHEQFSVQLSDGRYGTFYCHGQNTRYGFRHVCRAILDDYEVTASKPWSNRTWEDFRFCAVLEKAIEKFPEKLRPELTKQLIENRIQKEKEETAAFLEKFKRAAELASPGLKKAIIAGLPGGMIQTEEQAKKVLAIMQMGNLIEGKE